MTEKMNTVLPTIEVCLTPALFPYITTKENFIVVIVDILRATTAMCAAFENGAKRIIPVAKLEDAYQYRAKGCLIAGERDGKVISGADFGNSPFNFSKENVYGQSIALTTTNGTQTIEMAKNSDCVVIGSFLNLKALGNWLITQNKNIVILCAGWKNKFNLEDSIYSGALCEYLIRNSKFNVECDSALASLDMWMVAKINPMLYIQKASHRKRLKRLGLDDVIEYCFTKDSNSVIPILTEDGIINIAEEIVNS